ncbi:MAG: MutS-related protein [Longibaculum sp.]
MKIFLLICLCMFVILLMGRIAYNFFKKKSLINCFDYRLNNQDDELNYEYLKKIQDPIMNQQAIDDLELKEVFEKCDYTYSPVGKEYMYGRMFNKDNHQELLEELIDNLEQKDVLSSVIYALYTLDTEYSSALELFDKEDVLTSFDKIYLTILMIIPFALFGLYFVIGANVFFWIFLYIVFMMANYSYYKRKTKNIMSDTLSYCYLLKCLNLLLKSGIYPKNESEKIKQMVSQAQKYTLITRICHAIEQIDVFFLMETIKGLFLIPIHQCFILMKHKEELSQNLMSIYEYVGLVDVAVSVKTLRHNYQTCIPHLSNEPLITCKDAYHPLLKNPVKNTFSTTESCIITGSNASGKSTFIKMVGINMVMANALHTCFADEWCAYPFQLCTAIHMKDDIDSGESYFVKEIKTLKQIIDLATSKRCLVFIDEILRGTNERERVAISKVILKTLFESQSLVMITTHDLSIVKEFENIQKYCFNDYVKDQQLCCDYKIKEGICQVGNAIALLDVYGYPKYMTEQLKNN